VGRRGSSGEGWVGLDCSTCFLFQEVGEEGLGVGVEELEEGGMGNGHSGMGRGAVVKWEVSEAVQGGSGEGRYCECVLLNAKSPKKLVCGITACLILLVRHVAFKAFWHEFLRANKGSLERPPRFSAS